MKIRTEIAPPNSILVVAGGQNAEVPDSLVGGSVTSTRTSIWIITRCSADGATDVELGNEGVPPVGLELVYDGTMSVMNERVAVQTVEWDTILQLSVASGERRVRVWADRKREPTHICVDVS